MDAVENLKNKIDEIEEKLSYVFENKDFLILAFTHRSFINEYRGGPLQHNERLEFLGDSVLNLAVADYLYQKLPTHPEGLLSQLRSRLVDASACASYLQKLNVAEYILLGRGESLTEGRTKVSILSDAFEALLGAIYLDTGLNVTKSFLTFHYESEFESVIDSPTRNYKAELQDYSQKTFQKTPVYKVVDETGPDHSKIFHVVVYLDEIESGIGSGASKKEAEQKAAFDALAKRDVWK